MTTEFLQVRKEDGVVRITLDRPPVNVLNIAMLRELGSVLDDVGSDDSTRVLVLTGAGKAFCAGVDVADHTADRVDAMLEAFHGALLTLMELDVPVLAGVHGAALGGGCELVMACDVVLARDDARLGQPEIKLGVFPPFAAAVLPRLVGPQAAFDLILTGRVIPAREAAEVGLVRRVVPESDFESELEAYVETLAGLSGPVVRLTKRAVREGMGRPLRNAIEREEAIYRDELMSLADAHEGLTAFMEKREPVWHHG